MYLATLTKNGKKYYEIRQSFMHEKKKELCFRVIFNLGNNPARYLEQLSDDICYFSPELEESISRRTDQDPTFLLENLLWDFLPAEEQHRLSFFRHRGKGTIHRLTEEDRIAIEREVHLFDRRRLYYLKYCAVDQSRLFRLNPKLYRPLLNKSRDEREYYYIGLEKDLRPNEMKTYVFTIFDLQRYFDQSFSATRPEALNQHDIADHFIEELCNLNSDHRFWYGGGIADSLHDHLVRYLIMFFDHNYGRGSLFDDFLREFMGRHRAFSWPDKKPAISTDEITAIFDTDWKALRTMTKKELTRLYRKRAKELHPDKGGNNDCFVQLNSAYAALMLKK